ITPRASNSQPFPTERIGTSTSPQPSGFADRAPSASPRANEDPCERSPTANTFVPQTAAVRRMIVEVSRKAAAVASLISMPGSDAYRTVQVETSDGRAGQHETQPARAAESR